MADTTIGQKGYLEADLIIAQAQSFALTVTHEDQDGDVVDHAGDSGYCRFQRKNHDDVVLDRYVTVGAESIELNLPGSVTAGIEAGSWNWDLFVGDTRLLYGKATVYDTYARDDG